MYTKEQLEVAKAILLNLISDDREVRDNYIGICGNANRHTLNEYDLWSADCKVFMYKVVEVFSVGWKHHSGSRPYPIKFIAGCKWEGTNLTLRIDLMKYIVGKIDIMLEEM